LGEGDGKYNLRIVDGYLNNSDLNVVAVDWGEGAQTINYIAARNRVGPVGNSIAKLLDFLYDYGELDFKMVTLTGISLGAHVVGLCGKQTERGKVAAIIGLDPAGPLFKASEPNERLAKGDAQYVEVIHTNGATLGMGMIAAIGDADFYVNGVRSCLIFTDLGEFIFLISFQGRSQPGCFISYCSHSRAAYLFQESLLLGSSNNFAAKRCNNQNEAESKKCSGESGFLMGGEPSNAQLNLSGIFYLDTNSDSPYGRG
jgi:hypothetical protein